MTPGELGGVPGDAEASISSHGPHCLMKPQRRRSSATDGVTDPLNHLTPEIRRREVRTVSSSSCSSHVPHNT